MTVPFFVPDSYLASIKYRGPFAEIKTSQNPDLELRMSNFIKDYIEILAPYQKNNINGNQGMQSLYEKINAEALQAIQLFKYVETKERFFDEFDPRQTAPFEIIIKNLHRLTYHLDQRTIAVYFSSKKPTQPSSRIS
jgi:hypothetical protein